MYPTLFEKKHARRQNHRNEKKWERIYTIPPAHLNTPRKKIIKTTHLNITPFGVETCEAIKFALANKDKLNELGQREVARREQERWRVVEWSENSSDVP